MTWIDERAGIKKTLTPAATRSAAKWAGHIRNSERSAKRNRRRGHTFGRPVEAA